MGNIKLLVGALAVMALFILEGCSNGNDNGTGLADGPQDHAVGMLVMTFIDSSRPTSAHGNVPEAPSRTIETTIVYPAGGIPGGATTVDAPVDGSAAPYPLVVLSHGLGGYPGYLLPLAEEWAARGHIVALPRFPLTSNTTPGGPVAQDVQNQPADVSFIIDAMIAESNEQGALLSDSVDGEKLAAGGHSNGGITTYGLTAHSCCRDRRIDAAIVLSGAASPFADGAYDFSDTPPMLLLHGVHDDLVAYNGAVRTYNQLLPHKGLQTLEESDHGSYLGAGDPAFALAAQATADFLDGELRGDGEALARLPDAQAPGIATMHWAPDEVSNVPVEPLPEPETNRQAFLSADSGLTDGQIITVTWSGFLPERVVNIVQCAGDGNGGSAACNISGGRLFVPDPTGAGSAALTIRVGTVGNGVCDSTHPCTVMVNDAGLPDADATIRLPITLAD